jgi:hypothetical protein
MTGPKCRLSESTTSAAVESEGCLIADRSLVLPKVNAEHRFSIAYHEPLQHNGPRRCKPDERDECESERALSGVGIKSARTVTGVSYKLRRSGFHFGYSLLNKICNADRTDRYDTLIPIFARRLGCMRWPRCMPKQTVADRRTRAEIRTFGELLGHTADHPMSLCSTA